MLSAGAYWRAGLDTTVWGRKRGAATFPVIPTATCQDQTAWHSNLCPDCNQNKVRTKATGLCLSCETKRKTGCCLSVHGCTEKGLRPLPTPLQPSLESFNRDLASKTRGPLGVCLYLFPSTHPPHQPRSRSPGQNCAFVISTAAPSSAISHRSPLHQIQPSPTTPRPNELLEALKLPRTLKPLKVTLRKWESFCLSSPLTKRS